MKLMDGTQNKRPWTKWSYERDDLVAQLLGEGLEHKAIGVELGTSENAIRQHLRNISGFQPRYTSVTYVEYKLSQEVLAKLTDLITSVLKCNNARLGVKIEIGLDQRYVKIWKDPNGSIEGYDPDTMTTILNETL